MKRNCPSLRSQKELFRGKTFEPSSPRGFSGGGSSSGAVVGFSGAVSGGSVAPDRKLSVASSSSMKTKWLKAFRSLKPTSQQPADK